jgi:hypothetical protein
MVDSHVSPGDFLSNLNFGQQSVGYGWNAYPMGYPAQDALLMPTPTPFSSHFTMPTAQGPAAGSFNSHGEAGAYGNNHVQLTMSPTNQVKLEPVEGGNQNEGVAPQQEWPGNMDHWARYR